jgi:hypothetical protein
MKNRIIPYPLENEGTEKKKLPVGVRGPIQRYYTYGRGRFFYVLFNEGCKIWSVIKHIYTFISLFSQTEPVELDL